MNMMTIKINVEVETGNFDFIKDKSKIADFIRRELTHCLGVSHESAEGFKITATDKEKS